MPFQFIKGYDKENKPSGLENQAPNRVFVRVFMEWVMKALPGFSEGYTLAIMVSYGVHA
jgi:hypothetical protein